MAEQYYQVDKAHSWMIGDKLIDVQAGIHYGVRTVLVGTGYGADEHKRQLELAGEKGVLPYDFYAETLIDAARAILERDCGENGQRGIYGNVE